MVCNCEQLIFLIRVQSSSGVKRVECNDDETTSQFINKVKDAFQFDSQSDFYVYKDRSKSTSSIIPSLERKALKDYGLKHGDLVFLEVRKDKRTNDVTNNDVAHTNSKNSVIITPDLLSISSSQIEDEIDTNLWKESGLIERNRDQKTCKHGLKMKCVHCTPIEPYDEAYLKEHNIKHMSFHSYLRKLTDGVDKGKFAPLEDINCKVKPGCKRHLPYPVGICSACLPNAVTLNRQVYRHIDNVVFENASIVERFLNYWRTTGHQRVGMLYGYYDQHKDVPLGIKATVVAIYEPPQESTRDVIKMQLPEKNISLVNRIAQQLGLRRVGWIFTDLVPEDIKKGTVKHTRRADTYFLSAQECLMAGYFQTIHPNPCRVSSNGFFGSKFVTICATGDKDNQVHMEGYQVSNQCMALVRDNCFLPTKDAPELGYVREGSKEQYVPDVFFKEKDNFGNEITKSARPLPVEYLLVDVPVSAPVEQRFTLNPLKNKDPFPVENRFIEGHLQDFSALTHYLNQFTSDQFLEAMSDFHLLLYLATNETLPFNEAIDPLLTAIKKNDREAAEEWKKSDKWATVEQLILAQSAETGSPSTSNANTGNLSPPRNRDTQWSCKYCTFENLESSPNCEMCGLPK
ncbi:Nuclear protein localization protein 4-like protein [Leptotrombidium deliense]|uniref:Nuclear protein localization protein 4 homolog n=1 Tax=Leptotrombidium deliense TaxID=299467 RepID=A0A443ST38_9ACAR|nr:Nuclear protein localization protein 4-like protein [Leptotrombidium deliense]